VSHWGKIGRPRRYRPSLAAVVGIVTILSLGVAACGGSSNPGATSAGGAVRVVATTTVFADFVRQVGGDRVDVESLVPKGGDVHTFDPTPSAIIRLANARLVVMNGLGLDDWMNRMIENAASTATVIRLGEKLDGVTYLQGESAGTTNPHLWMNVAYAERYVTRIDDALKAIDPADGTTFAANAAAYEKRLTALDASVKTQIATIPAGQRKLVSFHDAFPYYADAYGLTIVGVVVSAPGQDPSAAQVTGLVAAIKAAGVKAVFSEAQFSPSLVQTIATEAGATVESNLYDDTLGDPPVDSYEGLIQWDTERVVAALR
jgi:ABC-type Zn uptake system ZnuABC Zn-binding protein ZnuA